jgi:thiosulfate/3-mercaptopyruvate sulfurtransferase
MPAPYRTLIACAELQQMLDAGAALALLDCAFDLTDPDAGERAFAHAHLPGARYVHLERDLSGPRSGSNGRHPLPERGTLARRVGAWGIAPGVQVVCYDAQGMPYAARAWWLLRWLGHDAVAVLEGGRSDDAALPGRRCCVAHDRRRRVAGAVGPPADRRCPRWRAISR